MSLPRGIAGGDHPRSRGVYIAALVAGLVWFGSSPLARGLPGVAPAWYPAAGIIPARAGFTPVPEGLRPGLEDHPRSRGVYAMTIWTAAMMPGSSPLARGLLRDRIENRFDRRIIPARAGFTVSAPMIGIIVEDHPRSRGVYSPVRRGPGARLGSSPLARGLPTAPSLGERVDSDHPRSRGVYHVDDRARQIGRGIIPARAGFTPIRRPGWSGRPDHPRSRGVYGTARCGSRAASGSSPLARGLLPLHLGADDVGRIIPARAGFTRTTRSTGGPRPDHPRSRGVYRMGG